MIDTPPSEQSHGLLDPCMMVVADAVVIPTKVSKDDITGAVKLLQRLAALDRLGVDYARPLGAVLVSAPTGAARIEARAELDLELITRHIPLFTSRIRHRPAPIPEAARRHQTLQQVYNSLPTDAERLRGLRTRASDSEHLTKTRARRQCKSMHTSSTRSFLASIRWWLREHGRNWVAWSRGRPIGCRSDTRRRASQQPTLIVSPRDEAERPVDSHGPKRRRRPNGESFEATNQLVGFWLPHEMATELRSRAEQAGLSNSEFVRKILRERFSV